MTNDCAGCGAPDSDRCRALFDQLLALEFSRAEPWGPLHGLTVAVYALQHPDRFADTGGWAGRWTGLHVYVTQGLASAERTWAGAGTRGLPDLAGAPDASPRSTPFTVTIADIAGPGDDFPAAGHGDRVDRWARATHADLLATAT